MTMGKYAVIENGLVVNVIVAEADFASASGAIACNDGVTIGDKWDGVNFIPAPPEPVKPPQSVTMRQARLALLQAGKLSAVNAAISTMSGVQGEAARIEWEFSNEVQRSQPLVAALAPVLDMDSSQLDQLFIAASKL